MTAQLHGISSMAPRMILNEIIDAYQEASVSLESVGGVEAAKRVQDGAPFDFVVLASDAIDRLIDEGALAAGSRVDLLRSGIAIAVKTGATRPAIDTEALLKRAVLEAGSIGYSTGPSGVALLRLFERWGISDELDGRLVQAPAGVPVGSLVASGEVALGFQQLSELMHLDGVDVLGLLPEGAQIVTIFSAGVCEISTQPALARRLLGSLAASAKVAAYRHGMQPA